MQSFLSLILHASDDFWKAWTKVLCKLPAYFVRTDMQVCHAVTVAALSCSLAALAPGPQPTTTPTWTLGPTSLPSPGPPWPTADDDDQAPLLLTVTISSPTSVFLSWEISSELDSSARSNIRSVRIEVLAVHDQSGEELQSFEIILPVQPNEYEYHFLHCGINAMFTISVNDTFSGVNGGVFPPGAHSAEVFLPGI